MEKILPEQANKIVRKLILETSNGKRVWDYRVRGWLTDDFCLQIPCGLDPYSSLLYRLSYKDIVIITDKRDEENNLLMTLYKVIKLEETAKKEKERSIKLEQLVKWSNE